MSTMLRQASRSSENDGAEYDYGDVLSKVENLEQSIIQHIRTSGVRKPRETALIDEVMDLRRERRKFSADVQNHIKSLENQNRHLSEEVRVLKERLDSEVEKAQVQSRSLPEQREADRLQFEERLKRELATQEEKLKFMEKINIAKVRNKFEERMKEMEIRANEMIDEKARAELKDARSIALGLVEKAKAELEKRCNEKIAEYKQSIVAISAREKELEGALQQHRQLISNYEEEAGLLKRKLAALSSESAARSLREKDLEMTNCTLLARVEALGLLENKLADFTAAKEAEIAEILARKEEEHKQHLAQVDDRIRKMLASKDSEMSTLRGVLRAKEGKLRTAEDALALINQEFASIKKR